MHFPTFCYCFFICRVCLLLSEWVGEFASEHRHHVFVRLMKLMDDDDLVVRLSALQAIRAMVQHLSLFVCLSSSQSFLAFFLFSFLLYSFFPCFPLLSYPLRY